MYLFYMDWFLKSIYLLEKQLLKQWLPPQNFLTARVVISRIDCRCENNDINTFNDVLEHFERKNWRNGDCRWRKSLASVYENYYLFGIRTEENYNNSKTRRAFSLRKWSRGLHPVYTCIITPHHQLYLYTGVFRYYIIGVPILYCIL